MRQRWAWMGVVGMCALLAGCRERERPEPVEPVATQTPAPAPEAAPSPGTAGLPGAAPAQVGTQPRQERAASQPMPSQAAPSPEGAGMTVTESSAVQEAPEERVMIGLEAVQAREDEAWHEGAAKAARAFKQNESVPLDKVVIATGTVDGRITRVDRGTLHLKDGEGNVYRLRIDKQSRGVRQGQSVPLRQLEEGTPVRASFDLVGGDSIARDIEVRR